MAFFNSIKRAFGFDGDPDLEVEGIDATVRPLSERKEQQPKRERQPAQQPTPKPEENDQETYLKIFDSVLEVFNEALPEFIRNSIDPAAQKRTLFSRLDHSLQEYLKDLEDNTRRRLRAQLERDRQRYEGELRDLRNQLKSVEDNGESQRQKQLSAERQKRALTERVRDLENQINTLMAEKEQFELENKSLLNKLRLTSVGAGEGDGDNRLAEQLEQLKAKSEIADKMVNEFKTTASQAAADLKAAQTELESTREELAASKSQLAKAESDIAEMRQSFQELDSINQELDRFEQIKTAKDKRIRELMTENERLVGVVENKKNEIKALQRVVEQQRQQPKDTSTADKRPTPAPAASHKEKKAKKQPIITAIDESLDDTDWLVSTPPPGLTIAKEPGEEFGYQEPERKQHPDNDAQMTLF